MYRFKYLYIFLFFSKYVCSTRLHYNYSRYQVNLRDWTESLDTKFIDANTMTSLSLQALYAFRIGIAAFLSHIISKFESIIKLEEKSSFIYKFLADTSRFFQSLNEVKPSFFKRKSWFTLSRGYHTHFMVHIVRLSVFSLKLVSSSLAILERNKD